MDASLLPTLPASCTGWGAPTAGAAGDTPPIPRVQPSEQPCSRAAGQHELAGSEEKDMAPGPPPDLSWARTYEPLAATQANSLGSRQLIPKLWSPGAAKPHLSWSTLHK